MKRSGRLVSIVAIALSVAGLLGAAGNPKVVDTITLTNAASVNHPAPISVNPVDGNIFIASYDGGNLIKYDPKTHAVKGEIKGLIYPEAVEVVKNKVYVASFDEAWRPGVYIYDAGTLDPVTAVLSPNWYVFSFCIDKLNDTLYYGTYGRVYKVDLDDYAQTLLVDLAQAGRGSAILPSDLTFDEHRGKLYVTCNYWDGSGALNGLMLNYDIAASSITAVVELGKNPAGFDYRYDGALDDERLFVTQMYSSSITVVNVETNAVIADMPGISWPQKLAVDANKHRLYVADNYSDKLHIIDTENLVLIKSIRPGDDPSGVVVDESNIRVYTANFWSQDIGVIDANSETLLERVTLAPVTPLDLTYSGGKLYVTGGANGGIYVVDPAARQVSDKVLPLSYSAYYNDLSVAAGQLNVYSGELALNGQTAYVTDEYNQSVAVFDLAGRRFLNHIGLGSFPSGVARSGNTIYYPYIDGSTLYLCATDGNIADTIALGSSEKAQGVAVNENTGKAYVADYSNNEVAVADISGKRFVKRVGVGFYPACVAVNKETNRIYVSNYGSNSVAVIDGASDTLLGYIDVGSAPWGIEVNSYNNRVYVVNTATGASLSVIDADDNTVAGTLPVGSGARYCAVDSSNSRVYVANQLDGTISVIEDKMVEIINSPKAQSAADEQQADNADSENEDIQEDPGVMISARITVPDNGIKISGNAVTVMAKADGWEAVKILFQYKPALSTEWINIAVPDTEKPFSVYWNVTGISNGDYCVRAIAYNDKNTPDPSPAEITVTVDDVNPDIVEDGNPDVDPNQSHKKEQKVPARGGASITLGDGTAAYVPDGAIASDAYLVIAEVKEARVPVKESVIRPMGIYRTYEFSDGTKLFNTPVQITLPYPDRDDDGIVDGTGIKAGELKVLYFNETENAWKEVSSRGARQEAAAAGEYVSGERKGAVSVATYHFTLFGLFYYAPANGLDSVIVYPNPYKPSLGHSVVTFDGLPAKVKISIYTIAGRPVKELSSETGGTVDWDVTNDKGDSVASGVYIYSVYGTNGGRKTGKIAVIR